MEVGVMLGWLHILALAAIQGLTGILPLSETGFLTIGRKLMGLPLNGSGDRFYGALTQLTLTLVICVVFRRDLTACIGLRRKKSRRRADVYQSEGELNHRMFLLILIAILPMLFTLLLQRRTAALGENLPAVTGMLLLNGLIIFVCDRVGHGRRALAEATIADSLLLGFALTLSVVPGLSGMAVAITVGIIRGLSPAFCVRFSCLLLIPLYLIRGLVQLVSTMGTVRFSPLYLIGMIVCGICCYFALWLLRFMAKRGTLSEFSYIAWGASLFTFCVYLFS